MVNSVFHFFFFLFLLFFFFYRHSYFVLFFGCLTVRLACVVQNGQVWPLSNPGMSHLVSLMHRNRKGTTETSNWPRTWVKETLDQSWALMSLFRCFFSINDYLPRLALYLLLARRWSHTSHTQLLASSVLGVGFFFCLGLPAHRINQSINQY